VLGILLERSGDIVLRSELYDRFWPGSRIGAEDGLNTAIAAIRTALGDSSRVPTHVETVPRRGYRFFAPVTRVDAAVAPLGDGQGGRPAWPGWLLLRAGGSRSPHHATERG
jgi:DNA-binding winged helix-turn-helix (wHTH) protein